MKLYDGGRAPNPRRVRIFLAEKGISVPVEQIDLGALQHKSDAYRAINPVQRVPALELDDGTVISESIAICRYFEAKQPEPSLFGRDPKEQAVIEMWERRVDFHFLTPVSNVFRHLHPAMSQMEVPQVAAYGEANKSKVFDFLEILDRDLAGRPFVAGDRFSVADITTLVTVDFMKPVKLTVPDNLTHVRRWYGEVSARPSAKA
ncbi:MAG: glutathione S-transferase family protein [Pseudolabrys sp.]